MTVTTHDGDLMSGAGFDYGDGFDFGELDENFDPTKKIDIEAIFQEYADPELKEQYGDLDPNYFSLENCRAREAELERTMSQMEELHQVLGQRSYTGKNADDLVTVTMSATGGVTSVEIDPYVVQRYGVEGLGRLVMAAIEDARRRMSEDMGALFQQYAPDIIRPDIAQQNGQTGANPRLNGQTG
jgi:DNA-binding protein YbaB